MAIFSRRRLAELYPEDSAYAKREYGVTDGELDSFVKRMDEELKRDREAGTVRRFSGDLEAASKSERVATTTTCSGSSRTSSRTVR
jgi:hypothetical protein